MASPPKMDAPLMKKRREIAVGPDTSASTSMGAGDTRDVQVFISE